MSEKKKWWSFGKNATKNNSPTYHYQKIEYSNPTDREFYNVYYGFASKLHTFILVCQLISGTTSLVVFFLTAFNKMPVLPYHLNYVISLFLGMLVVVMFEKGGKEALLVSWRQLLSFNFKNGEYVAMFFAVFFFAVFSSIINGSSSMWGGEEIAVAISNEPPPLDISENEKKQQTAIDTKTKHFNATKADFEKQLLSQKQSIDSKLKKDAAAIGLQKKPFQKHLKENPNSVWAVNQINKIDRKIAAAAAKAESEKKKLTDKTMAKIETAQLALNTQKTKIETTYGDIMATNLGYQKAKNAKTIVRNKRLEGWLPMISIFSVIGVIIGTFLIVLFQNGSGIKPIYMNIPNKAERNFDSLAFASGLVPIPVSASYDPSKQVAPPPNEAHEEAINRHLNNHEILDEKTAEKSTEIPAEKPTENTNTNDLQNADNQADANEKNLSNTDKKKTQKRQIKNDSKHPKIDKENERLLQQVFAEFRSASSAFERYTYEHDLNHKKAEHQLMVKAALTIAKTNVKYGLVGLDFGNLSPMHSGLNFQKKYNVRHARFGYKKTLSNKFSVLAAQAKKYRKEVANV
ncbi:MAG: hypothetical protein ACPG5B_06715 [Chitinophagales bacterium]